MLKELRIDTDSYRRAVSEVPCVHCGGDSQAAHINQGKGMGIKANRLLMALCPTEHTRIDQGGIPRNERRALEFEYAVLTTEALMKSGRLKVVNRYG